MRKCLLTGMAAALLAGATLTCTVNGNNAVFFTHDSTAEGWRWQSGGSGYRLCRNFKSQVSFLKTAKQKSTCSHSLRLTLLTVCSYWNWTHKLESAHNGNSL